MATAVTTKKKKTTGTWKTKKWFSIVAPKMFEEKEIGKTLAADPSAIVGRTMKITARDITDNFSQQHLEMHLKVVDIKGTTAYTDVTQYNIQPGYIRRQIKRRKALIDYVGYARTKDGVMTQLTVLGVAKNKLATTQKKEIRRICKDYLEKKFSRTAFEKVFQEVVFGKIAAQLFKECKRIYPLARVEVVKLEVIAKGEPRLDAAPATEPQAKDEESDV